MSHFWGTLPGGNGTLRRWSVWISRQKAWENIIYIVFHTNLPQTVQFDLPSLSTSCWLSFSADIIVYPVLELFWRDEWVKNDRKQLAYLKFPSKVTAFQKNHRDIDQYVVHFIRRACFAHWTPSTHCRLQFVMRASWRRGYIFPSVNHQPFIPFLIWTNRNREILCVSVSRHLVFSNTVASSNVCSTIVLSCD